MNDHGFKESFAYSPARLFTGVLCAKCDSRITFPLIIRISFIVYVTITAFIFIYLPNKLIPVDTDSLVNVLPILFLFMWITLNYTVAYWIVRKRCREHVCDNGEE